MPFLLEIELSIDLHEKIGPRFISNDKVFKAIDIDHWKVCFIDKQIFHLRVFV